uniref:RING-CH-type domain-containing protein n=1 Tax=Oryza barthii TaxID=65489 RepID=A0A0D3ETN7_9ORYZ
MRRDAAAVPTAAVASPPISVEAVVIDVEGEPAVPAGAACRICHLVPEGGVGPGSEVIRIGCGCKDELGAAHRHCAEAWFRIKGERRCEICGSDAKNIIGLEVKKFMEEWHGPRLANTRTTTQRESSFTSNLGIRNDLYFRNKSLQMTCSGFMLCFASMDWFLYSISIADISNKIIHVVKVSALFLVSTYTSFCSVELSPGPNWN